MFFVRPARRGVAWVRQLCGTSRRGLLLLAALFLLTCLWRLNHSAALVQTPTATIVSAANNESDALAPESLATAYGERLAVQSDVAAVPQMQLAGTTVTVAGRPAPLLFVSPEQVNFLVPAGVPPGPATVSVRSGDGTISTGATNVNAVAPALFTAGSVVSGFALRVKADGAQSYEAIAEFDAANNLFKPKAIDLNAAAADQVFLVFFLSGLRNADPAHVRVILGGNEYAPIFAGAVPGAPGLDQINLLLSRDLVGKGVLDLTVTAPNARPAKPAKIEIGGGVSTLAVSKLSKQTVVAGETLEIEGVNLPTSNVEVLFGPNVGVAPETATPTKLTLRVPYGVATDVVKISVNKQIAYVSPKALDVETSVSGFVQESKDNVRVAVAGMPVVLTEPGGRRLETVTNNDGAFLIRDAAVSTRSTVQIKGLAANGLNYEASPFGLRVFGNRDNQASQEDTTPRVIELKPNGSVTTGFVAADTPLNESLRVAVAAPNESAGVITVGQVVFDTNNSTINCPGGTTSCQLALAVFDAGRTPSTLPAGVFSSTIAQITPFGATLAPGGKLTFPNSDAVPAGTPVRVYRFDQTPASASFGQFVDIGAGVISGDGRRLETAANAVTQSSYYFISRQWPTATVIGHVVEADGVRPVRRAVVSARGQSAFTDGNGGFVLRNVPVIKSGDAVTLEISFHRADGTVARAERTGVGISAGAQVTIAADLVLPQNVANAGPAILAPTTLSLIEGETREFNFIVTGLAANVLPAVSGAAFATVRGLGNDAFALRLAPAAGSAGNYPLTIAAGSALQSVAVAVLAANAGVAAAQAQAVTTDEDTPKAITLTSANAGATPSYTIVAFPLHGALTGTPPNVTYTPATNYNGTDSFRFRVGTGNDPRGVAEVSLAVRPVNDPPVLTVPGAQVIGAGQTLALTITAVDPDGDALALTAPNAPPGATQNPPPTAPNAWRFTWTPTTFQEGQYTVNLRVVDPNGSQATRSVTISVGSKWAKTSGPEGGFVTSFLRIGNVLYLGAFGSGVYRSTDNGQSWTQLGGLSGDGLNVWSLLAVGNTIYAGTDARVYRSTDGGRTWIASAVAGFFGIRALIATDKGLYAASGRGVTQSTDGGQTWTLKFNNSGRVVTTLLAGGGNVLYAGGLGGLFRSTDDGNTWAQITDGLPPVFIRSLLLVGTTLLAGTLDGLYQSPNGASWSKVVSGVVGGVFALASNGTSIFAGTAGGVYRSTGNLQNWTLVGNGFSNSVFALLANDVNLLVGTNDGVYRSINEGQNIVLSSSGLQARTVYSLINTTSGVLVGTDNGLYRSSDNGQSWTKTGNGLSGAVRTLVTKDGTLYAGVDVEGRFGGVYRSLDNGQTWTSFGLGLTGPVSSLVVDGANLYAAVSGFAEVPGVFQIALSGGQWNKIGGDLPSEVLTVLVVGTTLYAGTFLNGVYRLTANDQSWMPFSTGLPAGNAPVFCLLANGTRLFAGTGNGLYRSDNGGTWAVASRDLQGAFIYQMALREGTLYAVGAGVGRSTDNGEHWTGFGSALSNEVSSFIFDGTKLFAGTLGNAVFLLTDNVQSWEPNNTNLANRFVNAVAVKGNSYFAGTLGGGVFRSTDQGTSWAAANNGLPVSANIQSLLSSGALLFAGSFGQGVYRSADDGNSWAALNAGLPDDTANPQRNPRNVNALRASGDALLAATDGGVFRLAGLSSGNVWTPTGLTKRTLSLLVNGATIYAGTFDDGVYRSVNGGQTWERAGRGLTNPTVTALGSSADGTSLFAGTDAGIFRSTDQGTSWVAVNKDLPANLIVTSFSANGAKLYAGSVYGVFLSEDNGVNWKQINAGLLDIYVTSLALSNNRLIAGAKAGGVFISQIPDQPSCVGISTQPTNKTITSGQSVTLTVTASGNLPFQFQWYRGASGDFSQPIAGATGNSFTTPALNATTNYWVLVTNGCGSASSETVSVLVNAAPQADVAVTQTITPAQPKPGDDLTFTLNLSNSGRDTAFAVNLTAALPAEVTVVSCTATNGGVCGGVGNNRTATFSALAAGGSATVTLVAKVNANAGGATLRSTAGVSAATSDTNPANNTDIKSVTVQNITSPRQNSVLRVVATSGSVGSTVAVPIELVSQGDENALGFSLSFDPAILSNLQLTLGSGASGATLTPNLNQAASGRVGLVLALPSGQRFAAGVRQIAVITFTIAANTGAAVANLEFGNQPIPREVVDVNANELSATYLGGAVTITRGFEADVAPRPNGNGAVTVSDWVLVGNFAAGSLIPESGSEFQRADCAPRASFGNGAITVSDWVQAGRYAAGLDPLTPAAGPTAPGAAAAELSALLKSTGWPRLLRVGSPTFGAGQTSAVTIELLAQGEENAVSFSLQFDAREWRFASATLGDDARQAALSVNTKFAADGQVGFALALPPGQRFDAGMRSLVTLTLAAAEGGGSLAPDVAFSDWPAARELADVKADVLTADWMPAAPTLFTVPSSEGLAAGVVIHVAADGGQRFEPLATFDPAQNKFVAVPIELGEENEQVFLALFGTGWQNGAALDAIQVTVGGLPVEVLYAAEQATGLAQLNLRLPPALRGRGEVTVRFHHAGRSANPVNFVIK